MGVDHPTPVVVGKTSAFHWPPPVALIIRPTVRTQPRTTFLWQSSQLAAYILRSHTMPTYSRVLTVLAILSGTIHHVCSGPLADYFFTPCVSCGHSPESGKPAAIQAGQKKLDCNADLKCAHGNDVAKCGGKVTEHEMECGKCGRTTRILEPCNEVDEDSELHPTASCSC